jgi:polyhydroxybutyrate depolymerase
MSSKSAFVRTAIPLVLLMGCGGTGSSSSPGNGGAVSVGGAGGDTAAGGTSVVGGASTGASLSIGGEASTGGLAATGGVFAAGGVSAGGTPGTGGMIATGGVNVTGGTKAAGGASTTGGTKAAGGASTTGGTKAAGGASTTGGTKAAGGASTTGGTKAAGGASTTGGSLSVGGDSAGCSLSTWPAACSTSGSPCSIDVSGTSRTYYVQLPSNYDPSSGPIPLVFQFHWRGGTAEQVLGNYYKIRTDFPNAIYVSPQGLVGTDGNTGWPNTSGQDVAFTKAMISTLETSYCVDKARLFSTGFSYGGIMSDTLGCQMPDVFRAIGVQSGSTFGACNPSHPIAAWFTHGDADTVLDYSGDVTARDAFLKANHCGSTSQAVTPSPCVSYDGCDSGYPVVWCLVAGGGHGPASYGGSAIATFFKQF